MFSEVCPLREGSIKALIYRCVFCFSFCVFFWRGSLYFLFLFPFSDFALAVFVFSWSSCFSAFGALLRLLLFCFCCFFACFYWFFAPSADDQGTLQVNICFLYVLKI